jgi:hypothetical protein
VIPALNTQGAVGGATQGAAVGTSVFPGWGTLFGALGGGVRGLLTPQQPTDPLLELTGFTTPQVVGIAALVGVVYLVTR